MAPKTQEHTGVHPKHKRTPSNLLKSLVTTRSQGAAATKPTSPTKVVVQPPSARKASKEPSVQPIRPLSPSPPLGEIHNNRERLRSQDSPRARDGGNDKSTTLHKRNKSAVSLRSLGRKNSQKSTKSKALDAEKKVVEPKKSKSSTNLAAIFSRPKSSRSNGGKEEDVVKDKENRTPRHTAQEAPAPPIWAQFATPQTQEIKRTTKIPLNDNWNVGDELALYTPQEYSPSKGRNFFEQQPALAGKDLPRLRPGSGTVTPSPSTNSLIDTFAKLRKSTTTASCTPSDHHTSKQEDKALNIGHENGKHGKVAVTKGEKTMDSEPLRPGSAATKRGSRVMAAVAVLNGKSKEPMPVAKDTVSSPAEVESAFEKMLVSNHNRGQSAFGSCLAGIKEYCSGCERKDESFGYKHESRLD